MACRLECLNKNELFTIAKHVTWCVMVLYVELDLLVLDSYASKSPFLPRDGGGSSSSLLFLRFGSSLILFSVFMMGRSSAPGEWSGY